MGERSRGQWEEVGFCALEGGKVGRVLAGRVDGGVKSFCVV